MGSKTITITDDVYQQLVAHKGSEESFSDVIRRLTAAASPLESAGGYTGLGDAVMAARHEFEDDIEGRVDDLSR